MKIFAIDPGPEQSAFVWYTDGVIVKHAKEDNEQILQRCKDRQPDVEIVIEQVACMGMAVGAEVFETVFWSGRFAQAGHWFGRIRRHEVKMHLCGNMRAKDANIRQALIDRYGGKEKAIGRKVKPGPLYGISGDCWSALAIAVTWCERTRARTEAA